MTALGNKIKHQREAKGWNQKELAEKADVSPATISGVENGRFIPTPSVLYKIAAELGVKFSELVETLPDPKLDTWLEIIPFYVRDHQYAAALPLIHRLLTEYPHMHDVQRDHLICYEAIMLGEWEQTRMQCIETLYALAFKWEGLAHTNPEFFVSIHNRLGALWYQSLEFITASHHYKRALEVLKSFPSAQDHYRVATIQFNLGDCLRWLGQDQEAIQYLEKALPYFQEQRIAKGVGGCYFALGMCYKNLGEFSKAVLMFQQAAPHVEEANLKWYAVRCRSYSRFFSPELHEDAIEVLKEELQELRTMMRPGDVATTKSRIAKLHLDRHQFPEAKAMLDQAENHLSELKPDEHRAYFLLAKALYHFALGDFDTASQYAFEAVDLYAVLRTFHSELQEALRISQESVLKLRESYEQKKRP
ncbi:helix-turn-helix transcriptional regulator [Tumebacillus sp. ITR2]|uniref:Helix-turn-helix transcriptional regulator n=1 Tax=Tumebacillus amylolyticus TaxID=2801339 RepID=A0ABS1JG02_9BACL|nr:tetratricopeptide repeat protein [Tumebacillus amylolyticus]MBL0389172.1 helix-turn-helix transcriptional regulator [Tumebacillus amylolyticus]